MQSAGGIEPMKANCKKTIEGLKTKDCRFALVPFGGKGVAGLIPSIPFTHDAEAFEAALGQSAPAQLRSRRLRRSMPWSRP